MDEFVLWIILLICGALAFSASTLTAGGGALMLVPVLNFLVGVSGTAPILNAANLIGRPVRLILYWKNVDWKAVFWYAPFAILGALIAGYWFQQMSLTLLQVIVGLFLVSTVFQYRWGKKSRSFPMHYWWLAPLGLIISGIGTLIGAGGPLLNPFYLNLGITKEALIGTKTINSFVMGLAQIGSYTFFGIMSLTQWKMAIALGIGIGIGNLFGKKLLANMTEQNFRKWAIAFMVLSGFLLIFRGIFQ